MSSSTSYLQPRVLISYARADGKEISQKINELLVSNGIPVWQDTVGAVGMEGGKKWWQQITKAIDKVEFIVLVATKAALESNNVKKEWLYARQKGVCVYPVKASPQPDYSKLPRWMKNLHFYDLVHEQQRFINHLNTRCQAKKVPFMAGDVPDDLVNRPDITEKTISFLVDEQREDGEPIRSTVVLHGAGGFGKTTLLKAICHSEKIRDAFDDGILWVTIGQDPTDLLSLVVDLIEVLVGERPGFRTLDAAVARLKELLSDLYLLIVIDDVWNAAHLKIFLEGGPTCARLISTRIVDIIPKDAKRVSVDAMNKDEAIKLLGSGLLLPVNNYPSQLFELANTLGKWPILLKLVNGNLYHRVRIGNQTLQEGIEFVKKALEKKGLTYFDTRDASSRDQAVAKTIGVSIELLAENERERYKELAVFPEDVDIPLTTTLQKLWGKTEGLDEFDTEDLCERLKRLSLVYSFDLNSKTVRLHDIIRKYLLQQYNKKDEELSRLHGLVLDSYADILPKKQPIYLFEGRPLLDWVYLAPKEKYLWKYLAYHLCEAGRKEELHKLLLDFKWIDAKLNITDASSLIRDYDYLAEENNNTLLLLIQSTLRLSAHVLNEDKEQLRSQVYGRLLRLKNQYPEIPPLLDGIRKLNGTKPWLRLLTSSIFNTPEGPLWRTIKGHNHSVTAVAVTPDGSKLVSAAEDDIQSNVATLKVWDLVAGDRDPSTTLSSHEGRIASLAITHDSQRIVSASTTGTMILWDISERIKPLTLPAHAGRVNDVIVTTNGLVVSASDDCTLKIWDIASGQERPSLIGHSGPVKAVVELEDGIVLSASSDGTLRLWDLGESLQIRSFSPENHLDRSAPASGERIVGYGNAWNIHTLILHPDGKRLLASSSRGIYMINIEGKNLDVREYSGQINDVKDTVLSCDGKWVVALEDNNLRVWDTETRVELFSVPMDHYEPVTTIASIPNDSKIVSGSFDHTIKIWDLALAAQSKRVTDSETDLDNITPLEFTPDGRRIICSEHNHSLGVWDLQTLRLEHYLHGQEGIALKVKVSSDGKRVASIGKDGTFRVWSVDDGILQFKSPVLFNEKNHSPEFLSFINDGYRVIITTRRMMPENWTTAKKITFKLIDPASGNELSHLAVTESGKHDFAIVPGSHAIVSVYGTDTVIIAVGDSLFSWDLYGKKSTCKPRPLHKSTIDFLEHKKLLLTLTDDCRYAVIASYRPSKSGEYEEPLEPNSPRQESALIVWDIKNGGGEPHRLYGHSLKVKALVGIPNTNHVASGGQGRIIRVWDIKGRKQLFLLRGHRGSINSLAAFPNGRLIASASDDQSLKVWDLEKKKQIATFTADKPLSYCTVAPDGATIIAYQRDGRTHILRLEGIHVR